MFWLPPARVAKLNTRQRHRLSEWGLTVLVLGLLRKNLEVQEPRLDPGQHEGDDGQQVTEGASLRQQLHTHTHSHKVTGVSCHLRGWDASKQSVCRVPPVRKWLWRWGRHSWLLWWPEHREGATIRPSHSAAAFFYVPPMYHGGKKQTGIMDNCTEWRKNKAGLICWNNQVLVQTVLIGHCVCAAKPKKQQQIVNSKDEACDH